jgi:hypothetical protein
MKSNLIFTNRFEDFAKIFLATLIVFIFMMMTDVLLSSTAFLLVTIFFLDGGHVYSTLLEVLTDPEEVRKKYVWIVLMGAFLLNFIVHLFFTGYFFYYVFYFTIYHNMRQGLGVTFLYRLGEKRSANIVKWSYYFLTIVPIVLFHMKPSFLEGKLEEALVKPMDLFLLFSAESLASAFKVGLTIYIVGAITIAVYLIVQKNIRGFLSMLFFTSVYVYAFLISVNELKSYALLIFSHAIPYYFLMEKRLGMTHKLNFVQKYAWLFLLLVFAIGGVLEYYQRDIITLMEPMDSLAIALLTTPLISHFIYDAILWKRGNERFKTFVESCGPQAL